eukprot:Protomagalhaensia_wolfi_Nauph_80__617@NODE_1352_length_1569_cov_3906_792157_g1044_i0_p2_GENE_NODE_1352_length_1569_cov_3906_792157_g1044_i0NODE_1352_length_1569_cov_3906_792157_g1044_i0_p2_ORF_typecomplete_len107_score12_98Integrin_beta/PF00362_18/9_9e06_NODE_1352_length_1569_cov_3906_792157_g1044_i0503823
MLSLKFFPLMAFLANAADEICYLPLDVMFLQDTTGSFVDDLPNVVRQIPDMVSGILESHPDSTFGVAEFKVRLVPVNVINSFRRTSPIFLWVKQMISATDFLVLWI